MIFFQAYDSFCNQEEQIILHVQQRNLCSFQSELLLSVTILKWYFYCFRLMWLVKHWKYLLYECCSAVFVKLVCTGNYSFLIVCTGHSAYKKKLLLDHVYLVNFLR